MFKKKFPFVNTWQFSSFILFVCLILLGNSTPSDASSYKANHLQSILKYLAGKEESAQKLVQKREEALSQLLLPNQCQKHLWFLFSKPENPEEQKAESHYKKALDALNEINEILAQWEEEAAEDIDTPCDRESIKEEFSYLLDIVETNIALAIEINPKHPGYYIIRGVKELMWGRVQNAKENFEMSVSLDPDFSDPENDLLPGDAELLIEICDDILKNTTHV
jgi:Tfp pilus assembly protein PilF